tara:strand:+ start:316 stop:420 length:105 start_codon:yes stop_codon:yes gene_type:complete
MKERREYAAAAMDRIGKVGGLPRYGGSAGKSIDI